MDWPLNPHLSGEPWIPDESARLLLLFGGQARRPAEDCRMSGEALPPVPKLPSCGEMRGAAEEGEQRRVGRALLPPPLTSGGAD